MFCRLHFQSGKNEIRSLECTGRQIRLSRKTIPAGVASVDFTPDLFEVESGSAGFFLIPSILNDGHAAQTFFRKRQDCECIFEKSNMPVFAMSRGNSATLAIVTGMPLDYVLVAGVRKGVYYLYPRFILDGEIPPEDLEIRLLDVPGGSYSEIAAAYRKFQLDRGACTLLRDRIRHYPVIGEALRGPEVRIRMAWKPVPPPVLEQTPENEPPIHVAVSFERACEIVEEFHRQGIENAEFCLVGWNKSGHDGRFPDLFPVEPLLGGEEGLRKLIKKARSYGYLISAHANLLDSYTIASRWRREDMLKNPDGTPVKSDCWSGGQSYLLCPEAAHRRFAEQDCRDIASLGFRGTHYLDVMSIATPRKCYDPHHPLSRREAGEWRGKTLSLAREILGSSGSEGSLDFCIGDLDYVLYTIFYLNPPMPEICDEFIPFWHLVYHGIVHYNTFCDTVNSAIKKDRNLWLLNVEWGGRPLAYYYAKFLSVGANWMGDEDLGCATRDELVSGIVEIKREFEEYKTIRDLQLEVILEHRKLERDVALVTYETGTRLLINRSQKEYSFESILVPPMSFHRF